MIPEYIKDFDFRDYNQVTELAGKGSGKTNLAAARANAMDKFIFVDTLGVLNPTSDLRSARIPESNYFMNDKNGTGDSVDMFIQMHRLSPFQWRHVIDFSEYVSLEERQEAINKLCQFVISQAKNSGNKYPVIIDEVADFAPEHKEPPEALHRLIKNGRNYGIVPVVIITQRPQSTSKQILDLTDCFVLGSQSAPVTAEYVAKIAELDPEFIKSIKPREFYISQEKKMYKAPHYRFSKKQ
jgi:hypothetical protein